MVWSPGCRIHQNVPRDGHSYLLWWKSPMLLRHTDSQRGFLHCVLPFPTLHYFAPPQSVEVWTDGCWHFFTQKNRQFMTMMIPNGSLCSDIDISYSSEWCFETLNKVLAIGGFPKWYCHEHRREVAEVFLTEMCDDVFLTGQIVEADQFFWSEFYCLKVI